MLAHDPPPTGTSDHEQKQRFLALSEEEQRAFLADKIGSKVPEEKLAEIQDAVISAVNGRG